MWDSYYFLKNFFLNNIFSLQPNDSNENKMEMKVEKYNKTPTY